MRPEEVHVLKGVVVEYVPAPPLILLHVEVPVAMGVLTLVPSYTLQNREGKGESAVRTPGKGGRPAERLAAGGGSGPTAHLTKS
jgi:hypothetical protein